MQPQETPQAIPLVTIMQKHNWPITMRLSKPMSANTLKITFQQFGQHWAQQVRQNANVTLDTF